MKNDPMRNTLYFYRNSFLNIVQRFKKKKNKSSCVMPSPLNSHILSLMSIVFQSTYSQATALLNSSGPWAKMRELRQPKTHTTKKWLAFNYLISPNCLTGLTSEEPMSQGNWLQQFKFVSNHYRNIGQKSLKIVSQLFLSTLLILPWSYFNVKLEWRLSQDTGRLLVLYCVPSFKTPGRKCTSFNAPPFFWKRPLLSHKTFYESWAEKIDSWHHLLLLLIPTLSVWQIHLETKQKNATFTTIQQQTKYFQVSLMDHNSSKNTCNAWKNYY